MATIKRRKKGESDGDGIGAQEKSELAAVLKDINKRFGSGIVVKASEIPQPYRIPTNIFLLDLCLLGGIPVNRVTQIEGNKHAGKTALAHLITVGAQAMFDDGTVVHLDVEGTVDSAWAAKLGVDTDRLLVVQPETGESAVDIMEAMIRSKEVSLIILDSLAALVPSKELEASAEDAHVGIQARLVSSAIRKYISALLEERRRGHYVTVLTIAQYRSAIGKWAPPGQEALNTTGGKAAGFANSVEIRMANKESSGEDEHGIDTVGFNEHTFTLKKNKLNNGPRSGEFRLQRVYDEKTGLHEGQVDDAKSMLVHAKKWGFWTGGGSHWTLSFRDFSSKFSGADEACRYLYENPEEKWMLRNFLIQQQAEQYGMPADFLARFD